MVIVVITFQTLQSIITIIILKFDSSHSFIQLFNVSIINFILNLLNNYIILPFLNRTETDQMKQKIARKSWQSFRWAVTWGHLIVNLKWYLWYFWRIFQVHYHKNALKGILVVIKITESILGILNTIQVTLGDYSSEIPFKHRPVATIPIITRVYIN